MDIQYFHILIKNVADTSSHKKKLEREGILQLPSGSACQSY